MAAPLYIVAAALAPIASTIIRYLVGYAIVRFITVFGVTIVTYGAIDYVGNLVRSAINSAIGSLPSQFIEVFSSLGGFQCINIVMSAYIGALSIKALIRGANRIAFGN